MILETSSYMIRSSNSNTHYWQHGIYPEWAGLNTIRHMPDQRKGAGVEPHYHDGDELWLFTQGRGEVWLDDRVFEVTPNTLVYTPMGVVHRFQMFTDFANVPVVTRLVGQQRDWHLQVGEDGPPTPTASGFVVPGDENMGHVADPGPRCPLTEFRQLDLGPGQDVAQADTTTNEYWLVTSGAACLCLGNEETILTEADVAILRAGVSRSLRSSEPAKLALAREPAQSGRLRASAVEDGVALAEEPERVDAVGHADPQEEADDKPDEERSGLAIGADPADA